MCIRDRAVRGDVRADAGSFGERGARFDRKSVAVSPLASAALAPTVRSLANVFRALGSVCLRPEIPKFANNEANCATFQRP